MRLVILFYHPKDPKNVEDIAGVASSVGAKVLIVPRPLGPEISVEGVEIVSLEEAMKRIARCYKVLLETYGFQYLDEAPIRCDAECIALIVGAEDYGVPRHVAEKLEVDVVARIPMTAEGMSYNVAASTTMGVYEVVKRCGLEKFKRRV